MKQKGYSRRKARGTRLLTLISVALVLTIAGIVALIGRVASGVTDAMRNDLGLEVIVAEDATPQALDSLSRTLKTSPYIASVKYTSAEDVNKKMRGIIGDDNLADVNPFQAEYNIKVKQQWSSADSLQSIAHRLTTMGAVYETVVHADMISSINSTISTVAAILLVVTTIMLAISFVLILNTVRLEVYAQRLVIHTMQYVGAKRGYIMRPYIIRSLLTGIAAGIVAGIILAALTAWGNRTYPTLSSYLSWGDVAVITGALMVAGALISGLATWVAAAKYLSRNYDEIFEH